jgi:hypothetical protein
MGGGPLTGLGTVMDDLSLSSPKPLIPTSSLLNICNTKGPDFPSSEPSQQNRLDFHISCLVENQGI